MPFDEIISRKQVLAGLPAKRANTLVFLIENHTAHLVSRSRLDFSFTPASANERDLLFFQAFSLGHAPPISPTIQHLERYTSEWVNFVPKNSRLKAALIHALSNKYNFTYQAIPNIRAALSLDETAVQQIYQRLYQKPLATVFTTKATLIEQLHWLWVRISQNIESLPSFWIACLVTVALGLPQGFLALPIAIANVGPLAAIALLIIIGTVNIFTIVCMAEAIGRSADFRYGNGFLKQLATNYLGKTGSFIFSLAVGIRVFLIAIACYIGLSTTMANFTSMPAQLWAALLFCFGLYLISQKSFNFTLTAVLTLAVVNISLLLFLMILTLPHVHLQNLLYVNLPFLNKSPFNYHILQEFFGVSLILYFGHVYVGECAKVVLPRKCGAASLVWGSAVGTMILTMLFCIWVLTINGALVPQILTTELGTVIEPLGKQIGSIVKLFGSILVIFLLGMAWIRSSSLLINLAREWIPTKSQSVLTLPLKQARLILHPCCSDRSFFCVGLTYLGLVNNQPKFNLDIQFCGKINHTEVIINQYWEIKELISQIPILNQPSLYLKLEIISTSANNVCFKLVSPMVINYEENIVTNIDKFSVGHSRLKLRVKTCDFLQLQTHLLLSISPLILVFLLSEWLLFTGAQSFTSMLSFAGVLTNCLIGWIFPILMLISSRQKGEIAPEVVFKILNHRLLVIFIYILFLAILLFHSLFIWQNLIEQSSAVIIAVLSLLATLIMKRNGAFAPRTIVKVYQEQQEEGKTNFIITSGGKLKIADVHLIYTTGEQKYQAANGEIPLVSQLRYITFQLPTEQKEELQVWVCKGKYSKDFKSLPAILEVYKGDQTMQFDLNLCGGKVLLSSLGDTPRLKLMFLQPQLS